MRKTKINYLLGAVLFSISAFNLPAQEASSFYESKQSEMVAAENGFVSKETFDGIIAFQNQVDLAVFALNKQPEVLITYINYINSYAENYISAAVFIKNRDPKLYEIIQQNFEQSDNNKLSFSDYFAQELLLNKLNSLYEEKIGLPRDKYFKQIIMDNYPELFLSYQESIPIKDITDFFEKYLPENKLELITATNKGKTGNPTGGGGPRADCGCTLYRTVQSDPSAPEATIHKREDRHPASPNQSFTEQWADKAPLYQRNQWNAKSWSSPQEVDKNTSLISTSASIYYAINCDYCGSNEGCVADVNYLGSLGTNLAVDTNVTGIFGSGVSESLSTTHSTFEIRTDTGTGRTMLFDKELTLMKSHSRTFNMQGIKNFVAAVSNAAKTIKIDRNGNTNDQSNINEVLNELITTGKTIMTNEDKNQAGASHHMKVEVDSTNQNGFSKINLRNGEGVTFAMKTNSHIKLKEADGASYHTSNSTGGVLGAAISGFQCTSGVVNKPTKQGCWLKGAGMDTPHSLTTLEGKINGFIGRSLGINNFDSTQYSNGCYY